MWVGIAALMTIPLVMVVLSLTLNHPLNRCVNIIVAVFWVIFNLSSIRDYPTYNQLLLAISMGFNLLTIWHAWKWVYKGINTWPQQIFLFAYDQWKEQSAVFISRTASRNTG